MSQFFSGDGIDTTQQVFAFIYCFGLCASVNLNHKSHLHFETQVSTRDKESSNNKNKTGTMTTTTITTDTTRIPPAVLVGSFGANLPNKIGSITSSGRTTITPAAAGGVLPTRRHHHHHPHPHRVHYHRVQNPTEAGQLAHRLRTTKRRLFLQYVERTHHHNESQSLHPPPQPPLCEDGMLGVGLVSHKNHSNRAAALVADCCHLKSSSSLRTAASTSTATTSIMARPHMNTTSLTMALFYRYSTHNHLGVYS
jgi:hypothetical protein